MINTQTNIKIFERLNIKISFAALALCLLSFSASAQNAEKITIQQAVDIALANNIQIKQTMLNEALSDANITQAKLNLYPSLNANSGLSFNFGRSIDQLTNQFVNEQITNANGSFSTSVSLFQGFQRINQIVQNKMQLQADKSQTAKAKNDLTLNVINTYLIILANRDLVIASQNQLNLSKETLNREQKLFDVGNKTIADLAQSKSQYAISELNLINAQNQLDAAKLNLAQLMEREPSIDFDVVVPATTDLEIISSAYSSMEVYEKALTTQPEITLAGFNKMIAKKGVDIAKGAYMPRLTMSASLGSGYSSNGFMLVGAVLEKTPFQTQIDNNFNQAVSFGLAIPIFNGYQAKTSVKRAQINFQNATYAEQLAKNNLNKTINQAVLDAKAAQKKYESALKNFEANKVAYTAVSQRYEVGLINSLDLSTSKTNFDKAQFDLIQAKYDQIFRVKIIDFYLGNPLTL